MGGAEDDGFPRDGRIATQHPSFGLRADARSAQIGACWEIGQCFQVSEYSGEPVAAIRARNLLSKDDCRAAAADETAEVRPKVTRVFRAMPFAGDRKGLAGAGAGPDGEVVGHAGEAEGERPAADAGEEVTLGVSQKVSWLDKADVAGIDVSGGEVAGIDEGADPGGGFGVMLVVVGHGAVLERWQRWVIHCSPVSVIR